MPLKWGYLLPFLSYPPSGITGPSAQDPTVLDLADGRKRGNRLQEGQVSQGHTVAKTGSGPWCSLLSTRCRRLPKVCVDVRMLSRRVKVPLGGKKRGDGGSHCSEAPPAVLGSGSWFTCQDMGQPALMLYWYLTL